MKQVQLSIAKSDHYSSSKASVVLPINLKSRVIPKLRKKNINKNQKPRQGGCQLGFVVDTDRLQESSNRAQPLQPQKQCSDQATSNQQPKYTSRPCKLGAKPQLGFVSATDFQENGEFKDSNDHGILAESLQNQGSIHHQNNHNCGTRARPCLLLGIPNKRDQKYKFKASKKPLLGFVCSESDSTPGFVPRSGCGQELTEGIRQVDDGKKYLGFCSSFDVQKSTSPSKDTSLHAESGALFTSQRQSYRKIRQGRKVDKTAQGNNFKGLGDNSKLKPTNQTTTTSDLECFVFQNAFPSIKNSKFVTRSAVEIPQIEEVIAQETRLATNGVKRTTHSKLAVYEGGQVEVKKEGEIGQLSLGPSLVQEHSTAAFSHASCSYLLKSEKSDQSVTRLSSLSSHQKKPSLVEVAQQKESQILVPKFQNTTAQPFRLGLENHLSDFEDSSSDEDTSDEAYENRHAVQEKEEIDRIMILLNPRLNKNKKQSKNPALIEEIKKQESETSCVEKVQSAGSGSKSLLSGDTGGTSELFNQQIELPLVDDKMVPAASLSQSFSPDKQIESKQIPHFELGLKRAQQSSPRSLLPNFDSDHKSRKCLDFASFCNTSTS